MSDKVLTRQDSVRNRLKDLEKLTDTFSNQCLTYFIKVDENFKVLHSVLKAFNERLERIEKHLELEPATKVNESHEKKE